MWHPENNTARHIIGIATFKEDRDMDLRLSPMQWVRAHTRKYPILLLLFASFLIKEVVGYFGFSPGEMETSMAMDQELRIATASNDSIPAATKVSPRWGARRDRIPPNTRSP